MTMSIFKNKTAISAIAFGAVLVAGGIYFGLNFLGTAAATDIRANISKGENKGAKIVAVVDGSEIAETELLPFLNAGLDKAVAIDRVINKVVAANSADKLYKDASRTAMQSAKNEILAGVFINQRSTEVRNAVTEADIKAFYQDRVKVEDFTTFRLRYFISVDAKEAKDVYDGIGRADKESMSKLTFVKKDGDHYLNAAEVPYGLGNAVKKLKVGERLQPLTVREGVLVLYVDDVKANPKPEFSKVQEEIKDLLVTERFNADIKARRAAAKVELRG